MGAIVGGARNGSVIGSDAPDALLLGRELLDNGLAGDKVAYGGPLHAVLFGPNGVGKGMGMLVPNLLTIQGKSVVVIDPKGQLAAMTAKRRHELGDDVKIIDPFGELAKVVNNDPEDRWQYLRDNGLVESCGFNPLANLNPESPTFYEDAAMIAEAIVKISAHDPHWGESAQGLVAGLVMWTVGALMWTRMKEGPNVSLASVRALLTEADALEYNEDLGKEVQARGLRVTAAKMVAAGEEPGGFEVASLAARFATLRMSDELESIRSTADTQTRWLLSSQIRKDLGRPGFDFSTLKTGPRPTTVYVILPSKMLETHSVWLRLVVTEALRANLNPGGRGVLLLLDEFAALGHLAIVQNLFGVTRDYRLQMVPVFQDLPQLQHLYPDRWETLLSSAGVIQSFRVGDMTTAKWLSERSGQMTVMGRGFNESATAATGGSRTSGSNEAPMAKPTIFPQDLFGLPDGHTIAFFAGERKPFRLYLPHFTQVRTFREWALPNPYF